MALLGRPSRKPTWADLRDRFAALSPSLLPPDTEFGPLDHPAQPAWVRWHNGPAISSVQAAIGEVPGWQWRAVAPALTPGMPPAAAEPLTLWIRRSFSPRALAVGLVRFYASQNRHFTLDDERGREPFALLLDVDEPEVSGYPIVEGIVDRLLAAPDVDPVDDDIAVIDALSHKLRRLGYDNLWAEAYKAVR
ncbi:MAG: hypothetical protein AB7L13_00620 [Acidimicrobiia bacterium]